MTWHMAKALFDARLLSRKTFEPHAYDDLVRDHAIVRQLTRAHYTHTVTQYRALKDITVERIIYRSANVKVTGVMVLPAEIRPGNHPLLIYNRGGNGEFGKLTMPQIMRYMATFTREGYLVFGSNYRGNDGSEGRDEMGGADLADVTELLSIARHHPGFDQKNSYMMGTSRGGTMTYLALKEGMKLNAAATMAAPTDFTQMGCERAEMIKVYQ